VPFIGYKNINIYTNGALDFPRPVFPLFTHGFWPTQGKSDKQ